MDFKILLKELYVYDPLKIWNTIQIQFALYSFSQYAEKKILDSFDDETSIERFESLLELYESYLPKELIIYLPQLIENLEEFELLEPFTIQLGKTLEVSLETEDELLQNSIANFIDTDIYDYFNKTIPTTELFYESDGELNIPLIESIFKNLKVDNEVIEIIQGEDEKIIQPIRSSNSLAQSFQIRKRTLRKKGIYNLTPMKTKTKRFYNKSLKNRKL